MGETTRRTIGPEERRARLAVRHRLAGAARAGTAEEVAGSLVALHATDAATVFLAVGARLAAAPGRAPDPVTALEQALYGERTLTRMHGMRHTLFVVPSALAAVVHSSTADAASVRERTTLVKHLTAGSDYDAQWLAETERQVLAELAARGEATGAELGAAVPRLRAQYVYGVGTNQEGPQSVASRVLRVLGMEGRIARGRPQGGWTSSRFRWAPAPPYAEIPRGEAQAELVRHWLAAYGPATEADLKWWTGWKVTDVRRALAAVGAERVALEEGTGFVLPDDLDPVPVPVSEHVPPADEPWAALLPALDPTPMGWQSRDWYLDPAHRAALFDRSGNIGPTVWWNGRIVGGWAQRADGEIVWRLFTGAGMGTDLGKDAVRAVEVAVEAEAARLAAWVGEVRITPRFRTPLEKELSSL
ncbi:winged helix DNA-binding domain-containing protein [Streptomyces sp. SKN60]|uniref:winged helix DNA-binding domain-containing protein n=1 Tax=Streptomyces sp. SKN60 TaxID=2855506 RepID=UPI0022482765|nr:winged helix DNA-binding domain-containing protein [Streptomyces sp. SKN60]MCX2179017.1 winged helix DNA-binding domain-containing protein [Streptomyces sp. SKN60]